MTNNNINKKVLYVEDDDRVSKEFINLLKSLTLDVNHYEYAEDAYIDFQINTYDLLIIDIELPKQNGLDLIGNIRLINKYIPIIILTAYDNREYLIEAINCQATKYIIKPIDTTTFLPQLTSLLNDDKFHLMNDMFYYPNEHKLQYKNKESHLTESEHIILNCLYNNKGHLVTYDLLTNLLNNTTLEILRTHIKNIRKKSSNELIETIPTLGYKFNF